MLTTVTPTSWDRLQDMVGEILAECGMHVEVEKTISTVRGLVEVDVYAEEIVHGRKHVILCECKHWNTRVPKAIVHSFRSVMDDFGANKGYIISSSGFQSGSFEAAQNTNIELVTWPEFLNAFEGTWIEKFFTPRITEELEPLTTFTEPIHPDWFQNLPDHEKVEFDKLVLQHLGSKIGSRYRRATS